MYTILDIEATGGKKGEEEIIEIALYKYDGKKLIDQLISLVSPNREIDAYVQKLTQITTKMVKSAPKFHELAKRIVEITDGTILVGHNVEFDYRMLKQEFKKLGYTYYRETIDTVPLSEKYFPDAKSYSLGKLTKELGIPVSDRHRASGDARATLELFKLILDKDDSKTVLAEENKNISNKINSKKYAETYQNLPNQAGILYFYNDEGHVIYLTRSLNIAQKARKILTGRTGISNKVRSHFSEIKAETTGNELISWIKENHEIKTLKPLLNESRKKIEFPYSIYLIKKKSYKTLVIQRSSNKKNEVVLKMSSLPFAQKFLSLITEEYELCPLLNEISPCKEHCFSYEIGECHGACIGKENYKSYNKRVNQFLDKINLNNKNFLIICEGREIGEKSFVWMKNGDCKGYGYFNLNQQIKSEKMIRERMIGVEADEDVNSIVKGFLFSEKYTEIIPLDAQ